MIGNGHRTLPRKSRSEASGLLLTSDVPHLEDALPVICLLVLVFSKGGASAVQDERSGRALVVQVGLGVEGRKRLLARQDVAFRCRCKGRAKDLPRLLHNAARVWPLPVLMPRPQGSGAPTGRRRRARRVDQVALPPLPLVVDLLAQPPELLHRRRLWTDVGDSRAAREAARAGVREDAPFSRGGEERPCSARCEMFIPHYSTQHAHKRAETVRKTGGRKAISYQR